MTSSDYFNDEKQGMVGELTDWMVISDNKILAGDSSQPHFFSGNKDSFVPQENLIVLI